MVDNRDNRDTLKLLVIKNEQLITQSVLRNKYSQILKSI
jgi:hypothetical protein